MGLLDPLSVPQDLQTYPQRHLRMALIFWKSDAIVCHTAQGRKPASEILVTWLINDGQDLVRTIRLKLQCVSLQDSSGGFEGVQMTSYCPFISWKEKIVNIKKIQELE